MMMVLIASRLFFVGAFAFFLFLLIFFGCFVLDGLIDFVGLLAGLLVGYTIRQ